MADWTFRLPVEGIGPLRLTTRWLRNPILSYRGQPLARLNRPDNPFLLILPDGTHEHLVVKRNRWDPLPRVLFHGDPVRIAPPMRWWEWLLCLAPLTLAVVGGGLGGAIGGSAASANLLTMRIAGQRSKKYVSVIAITVISVGVWLSAALALTAKVQEIVDKVAPQPVARLLDSIPAPTQATATGGQTYGLDVSPPAVDELDAMRGLLARGAFDSLDARMTEASGKAAADERYEVHWWQLFTTLSCTDLASAVQVNAWVSERPGSRMAHLLRGASFVERAMEARGEASARNTSPAQFAAMQIGIDSGLRDLGWVLKSSPDELAAYVYLQMVGMTIRDPAGMQEAFRRATVLSPFSPVAHVQMAWALDPRWGGSDSLLGAFADKAERDAESHPGLLVVRGLQHYQRARRAHEAHDAAAWATESEQALQYGTQSDFFVERAEALWFSGEYDGAVALLRRGIALNPLSARLRNLQSEMIASIAPLQTAAERELWFAESRREAAMAARLNPLRRYYQVWVDSVAARSRLSPTTVPPPLRQP
ncbi:MAG: DUF4034 domain-containing protein [Gemmatimonadaceae bacterium]